MARCAIRTDRADDHDEDRQQLVLRRTLAQQHVLADHHDQRRQSSQRPSRDRAPQRRPAIASHARPCQRPRATIIIIIVIVVVIIVVIIQMPYPNIGTFTNRNAARPVITIPANDTASGTICHTRTERRCRQQHDLEHIDSATAAPRVADAVRATFDSEP